MLESKEEINLRIVYATAAALFDLFIKPQFPDMEFTDAPRRVLFPLLEKAKLVAGVTIHTYEISMKLNGYDLPTLLSPQDEDEDIEDE